MKYILSEKNLSHIVDFLSEAMSPEDMVNLYKIPFKIDDKFYNYYSISSKKDLENIIPNLIAQAKTRFSNNKYRELSDTNPEDSYLYQWIIDRIITETGGVVDDNKRFFTKYLKTFFGEPELINPEPIRRIDAAELRKKLFREDGDSFRSRMSLIKKENPQSFMEKLEKIVGGTGVLISEPYSKFINKIIEYGKQRVAGTILGPNAVTLWKNESKYKNENPTDNKFCVVSYKPFLKNLIDNPNFSKEPSFEKINTELKEILLDPKIVQLNSRILGSDAQTYRLIPMTRELPFMGVVCKRYFDFAASSDERVVPQSAFKKGKNITIPTSNTKKR